MSDDYEREYEKLKAAAAAGDKIAALVLKRLDEAVAEAVRRWEAYWLEGTPLDDGST